MKTKDKSKCPWCGKETTQMKDSKFFVCIAGTPSGDPRGWGCGWWGELGKKITPWGGAGE